MASLVRDPNGTSRILFLRAGKRYTVRLGEVPEHEAKDAHARIEAILAGRIDDSLRVWLSSLDDTMAKRFAKAGLALPRVIRTLGDFLADYKDRASDVKDSTRSKIEQVEANLLAHFPPETDLRTITVHKAEMFKKHMQQQGYAAATMARRLVQVRSIFADAKRLELIASNPFETVKVRNHLPEERKVYVPVADILQIIDVSPPSWQIVIALARFAGLRCPSEILSLRWADVNWSGNRISVPSPKTEHLPGKSYRVIPIFAELKPHLQNAFDLSEGEEFVAFGPVMSEYRQKSKSWDTANLGTTLKRFIRRAGIAEWPKPFHNLRASCETDLLAKFPIHVVCEWIGNSPAIAIRHYAKVTAADFEKAAHKAAQSGTLSDSSALPLPSTAPHKVSENLEIQAFTDSKDWALLDLNQTQISLERGQISEPSGALCGTLAELVSAWPSLSPEQQSAILEIAAEGVRS